MALVSYRKLALPSGTHSGSRSLSTDGLPLLYKAGAYQARLPAAGAGRKPTRTHHPPHPPSRQLAAFPHVSGSVFPITYQACIRAYRTCIVIFADTCPIRLILRYTSDTPPIRKWIQTRRCYTVSGCDTFYDTCRYMYRVASASSDAVSDS